jgi:conjugal transfer pilus assembly protein TraU
MKKLIVVVFCFFLTKGLNAMDGTILNPVTDICWKCFFPIHVSGMNVTPSHKPYCDYKKKVCSCKGTLLGIPLAFWEPNRLIDVTRTPYKLVGFGGITLSSDKFKKHGTVHTDGTAGSSSSYHVHYYQFPILELLGMATDFVCTESNKKDFDFDVAYMSEFDPFWQDSLWTSVLNPEAFLFANPLAQVACLVDCGKSTFFKPENKLFWCCGCQGSLYPLTGYVSNHVGAIQASSLLVHRVLAKLHAWKMLQGFDEENFCEAKSMHFIKKSLYKTQLVHPIPQTKGECNVLGKSDVIWGSGKSFPYKGEDFVYLIWVKRQCCLDPIKAAAQVAAGQGL